MLTRFQVMSIATAIERVQGGEMTISTSQLCDLIRASAQEMEYYHDNPLDALKMVESHLTDAINMLDQANNRQKLTSDLEKQAESLMAGVQMLIRWMERPEPEIGDDGHDTWDERHEKV